MSNYIETGDVSGGTADAIRGSLLYARAERERSENVKI